MAVRFELPPDHPHVAVVTIDRPEQANALDPPTIRALADAWRRVRDDAPDKHSDTVGEVGQGRGERPISRGSVPETTSRQSVQTPYEKAPTELMYR